LRIAWVGDHLRFEERLTNIFQRYGETHIVTQAIQSLSLAIQWTQQVLYQAESNQWG